MLLNQSYVLILHEGDSFQLKDSYFMTINFFKSGLTICKSDHAKITNFNIETIKSMELSFIIACFANNCYWRRLIYDRVIIPRNYKKLLILPYWKCNI